MMTEKRYTINGKWVKSLHQLHGVLCKNNEPMMMTDVKRELNELHEEKQKLERINKGQEKEIVRLHKLADAMSGVLRELGIYDVYNKEQIQSIKEKLE